MIRLLELDLADRTSRLADTPAPSWVVVRAGPRVLGELRFEAGDTRGPAERRAEAARRFGPRLLARDGLGVSRPAEAPNAADVTVVVCTRDRAHFLDDCLHALGRLDPAPGAVLVVDNAPSGRSAEDVAARHDVDYVVEPRAGLNRARNTGWRRATTELVAYVDDDARADRYWAGAVARGFLAPEVGAVTGLVLPAEIATRPQLAFEQREGGMRKGFERRLFRDSDVGIETYHLGVGTNLAARRAALERTGGFDPRIGVGTPTRGACDLDFFYRLLAAGYLALYEPDALVRHVHRRTRAALLAQMRDYGISYSSFLALRASESPWLGQHVWRQRLRWHWVRHGRRVAGALRRGNLLYLQMAIAEARGSLEGPGALRRALAEADR